MDEAKFTKGEWYIHPNGIGCGGASIVSVDKCADSVFSSEEELANLDLIVLAPDMYEMLKGIAISMECFHGVDTESIFELLAKARGETK